MNECVTSRVAWRSLLIIGMVAMVAVPSWSLSQQPSDDKKPEKTESQDQVIRLTGQQIQAEGDVVVELVADDKQPNPKEGDRLDRLEKQLDALLKEIKTLRGEKTSTPKKADFVPGAKVESKVIIRSDKKDEPKRAEKGEKGEFKEVIIFTDKKDEPKKAGQWEKGDYRFEVIQPKEKPGPQKVQWANTGAKDGQTFAFTMDANDANSTMLSRTTYKMPKEKAEALAAFLKDQVKSPVLETKVDGESIVVTTTPEAQKTIGQFIALVQGKASHARINFYPTNEPIKVNVNYDANPKKE
jgi:hypothetical protein